MLNHNEKGAMYEIPNGAPVKIWELFSRASKNVKRVSSDPPPRLQIANFPWECGGDRQSESSTCVGAHVPDAMNCSPKSLPKWKKISNRESPDPEASNVAANGASSASAAHPDEKTPVPDSEDWAEKKKAARDRATLDAIEAVFCTPKQPPLASPLGSQSLKSAESDADSGEAAVDVD